VPKLFVAVDLPPQTTCELARLQPSSMVGIRLAEPGQMHLTLHFIGEAAVDRMASALQVVSVQAFKVVFECVGKFRSSSGAVTLWAGVRRSDELLALHSAVADALVGQGFQPEARPYTPHVTLARCEPTVPTRVVDEFFARHAAISVPALTVVRFGLYSSVSVGNAPVYHCERSFPFLPADTTWIVHRQDDNGNQFVVQTGLSQEEAERFVAVFTSRGHKQFCWAERDEVSPKS
jgi:2'-5' RNA ligase